MTLPRKGTRNILCNHLAQQIAVLFVFKLNASKVIVNGASKAKIIAIIYTQVICQSISIMWKHP